MFVGHGTYSISVLVLLLVSSRIEFARVLDVGRVHNLHENAAIRKS